MRRIILTGILFLALTGCTSFVVREYDTSGNIIREVKETGAPLISRTGSFTIRHEWLGPDNVLHEESVTRGIDENASAQLEMVKLMRELAEAAAKGGAGL